MALCDILYKRPRNTLTYLLTYLLNDLDGYTAGQRTVYEETTSTIKGRESQTIAGVARWRPC